MKKKLLVFILAVVVLITSTTATLIITNAAGESDAYSVANPVNKLSAVTGNETLHSEKLSNFTAAFDYTPNTGDAKLSLRYDYDSTLKKTAVNEDFESYDVDDKVFGNMTVVNGGARGLIGKFAGWKEGTVTFFKGTDYDATFWISQDNSDWSKMNIKVKDGVQFVYRGAKHGGESNTIWLVNTDTDVNYAKFFTDEEILASFNLKDYGYDYNQGEIYYRVTVTKDNIKMYISPADNFDGLEPVIDYTLPEELAKEESELTFSSGDTDNGPAVNSMFIDDLKITDLTKDGYETVTETIRNYEKYEKVFEEDFEDETAGEAVYGTTAVIKSGENNVLDFGKDAWNVKHTIAENLPQNSSIVFHIWGQNPDWDNIHIYINDDLQIQFTGSKKNNPQSYTAKLMKDGEIYATANTFGNLSGNGKYIRIDNQDGLISVYINTVNDFEDAVPVISKQVRDLSDTCRLYIHKEGNSGCRIDNIAVYDFGSYTEETVKVHSGEYGMVTLDNAKVAANEVKGTELSEIKSSELKLKVGEMYRISVLRDRTNLIVNVDGKEALKATVPYDTNNFFGEVALAVEGAAVENVEVYDSGRITFEDRGAVLSPYGISDNISILAKSSEKNKLEQFGTDLNAVVDASQTNSAINTTAILTEDAGDLVFDYFIKDGRSDWINDTVFIGVPGEITNDDGHGYQYAPSELYRNGYAVEFGAYAATSPYYNIYNVVNGASSSVKRRSDPIEYHWGSSAGHVRIERKGNNIRVYMAMVGDELELVDEIKTDKHLLGNVYWYHRQANANMMNIKAYDTANRIDYTAGAGASADATRLVAFYSTTKTDKDILIEESESTYEKVGPWYYIKNPHRNATYLKQSLTGDVTLSNMDMSFEFYGGGYWMTNTFYFASSNKYGTTSYALTIKGDGTAGLSADKANLILSRNYYGKSVRLAAAKVPRLTNGAFKFHITIDNGKIKVMVKAKNAPDSEATVLEGDSGGLDIRGGVYMYMYDDCYTRLKDIVIYNGVDTSKAEQPDLTIAKKTVLSNDFEDADNIPVNQYKNEKTGAFVLHDAESGMLQFNTNHNNYIQSAILPTDDWLEDLTIQFDYLGHRGDWNINFFAWHCARKSGDRYSSLYLAVLGNNVANNAEAGDNIAKEKGANVQLIASEFGKKTCLGWASIPDINAGRQHSIRITQEGGLTKVWVWPSNEDMPTEPAITATNYHPELCYGGFFVHSWCGNFSIDNIEILNYANYVIPEPTSYLNKPIGEIFRVDRIYETVAEDKEVPIKELKVEPGRKSHLGLILGITIPVAAIAISVPFIIIYLKKRKKKGENIQA